jgi:hypothetical protein
MNINKYKSVAMDIDHWNLAGDLAKHIAPEFKISKKRVIEYALSKLALSTGLTLDEQPTQTISNNEVSIKKLNQRISICK